MREGLHNDRSRLRGTCSQGKHELHQGDAGLAKRRRFIMNGYGHSESEPKLQVSESLSIFPYGAAFSVSFFLSSSISLARAR